MPVSVSPREACQESTAAVVAGLPGVVDVIYAGIESERDKVAVQLRTSGPSVTQPTEVAERRRGAVEQDHRRAVDLV